MDCMECKIRCQHESYLVTGRPKDCPLEVVSDEVVPFEIQLQSTREVIDRFAEDRVKVVRCKDCKWAEKAIFDEYCVECTMYKTTCMKHGYCHNGERKEL